MAAERHGLVHHLLDGRVRHRPHLDHQRLSERAQPLHRPLAFLERADVTEGKGDHGCAVEMGGHERCGRRRLEGEHHHLVVPGLGHVLAVEAQGFGGALGRVQDDPARHDGADGVQTILEGGHQAQIAAAAAQAPEQVGVVGGARRQQAAVGGDDVGRQEIVDDETALAHQPAETAPEREAGNPRRRDLTPGRGQAERLRLVIEIAPRHAGLRRHRAPLPIDPDALHRRQVDHEPAVADGVAGDVVTAAAHGDQQLVGPREIDGGEHVGRTGAPRDQGGLAVDRAVPDTAGGVVAGVTGLQQRTTKAGSKFANVHDDLLTVTPVLSDAVLILMSRRSRILSRLPGWCEIWSPAARGCRGGTPGCHVRREWRRNASKPPPRSPPGRA